MKLSVLRHHANLFTLYQRKQKEIEYLYDTRRSVASSNTGVKQSIGNYYDPVQRAVFLIDEKKEDLYTFLYQILEEEESIFMWLDQIPDHAFRAIVICHFINGHDWKRTDQFLYQAGDGSRSRVYFTRYINKHPELIDPD